MNFHRATSEEIQALQYVGTWVYVPPANYTYYPSVGDTGHYPQLYELIITRQQTSLLVQAPALCQVFSACSPQVGVAEFSTTAAPQFVFTYCDSTYFYQDNLTLTLSADGTTLQVHEALAITAGALCAKGKDVAGGRTLDFTMRRLVAPGGQTTLSESLQVVTEADRRVVNL